MRWPCNQMYSLFSYREGEGNKLKYFWRVLTFPFWLAYSALLGLNIIFIECRNAFEWWERKLNDRQ